MIFLLNFCTLHYHRTGKIKKSTLEKKNGAARTKLRTSQTYSWVNEFVPFGWLNESVVNAHKSDYTEYYASVDQVNEIMAYIHISIAVHASVMSP